MGKPRKGSLFFFGNLFDPLRAGIMAMQFFILINIPVG